MTQYNWTGPRGRARGGLHRPLCPLRRPLVCDLMAKTLVIAEKPSVGKGPRGVLPGPFPKHEG